MIRWLGPDVAVQTPAGPHILPSFSYFLKPWAIFMGGS